MMARLSFRAIICRNKGSCLQITKLRSLYCYLQRSSMVSFAMKFGPTVMQGFMSEGKTPQSPRFPGNFSRAPTCSREVFPIRQSESRLGSTGVGRREVSQPMLSPEMTNLRKTCIKNAHNVPSLSLLPPQIARSASAL